VRWGTTPANCPRRHPPDARGERRQFEYFGGHTHEHLYDRPRTVCQGTAEGRILWNATFRSFADYWGFEPRLCQPYRAQTKGKVESGVKYFRRNFLPGRRFVDDVDFDEQLRQWMTEIADQRIHGTTHERPIDRFVEEQCHLVGTAGHPGFRLRPGSRVSWPRIISSASRPIAIRCRSRSSARRSRSCAAPAAS